jgi:hypothetical protein
MEHGLKRALSGAFRFADAMLCPDNEEYLDREQGIPHLKGFLCRVAKLGARKEEGDREATERHCRGRRCGRLHRIGVGGATTAITSCQK